jgi:hypothetical protein
MGTDSFMAKRQKLIVLIICCIGVFIFPFASDCQISIPGFAYTPGVSGQVIDKNGKPLPGAYILYDYHGYANKLFARVLFSKLAACLSKSA